MKRRAAGVVVALVLGGSVGMDAATADATSPNATCEAILVSAATYPGQVADLGRLLHDQLKAEGIPPGFLDAGAAQVKAGSVDACLAALEIGA
jgi:hypothetical protein